MVDVPLPPASLDTKPPPESKETLTSSLDVLLERYLNLLDDYQKLQQRLNQNLSNGYIALAQANFSNPNRIRYGQDYYDDRMQASTHVVIEAESPCFKAAKSATAGHTTTSVLEKQDSTQTSDNLIPQDSNDVDQDTEKESKAIRDPLHWFGILLPSPLRASQNQFKIVTAENIPAIASLAKELKEVEIEVRRARKKLKKAS